MQGTLTKQVACREAGASAGGECAHPVLGGRAGPGGPRRSPSPTAASWLWAAHTLVAGNLASEFGAK